MLEPELSRRRKREEDLFRAIENLHLEAVASHLYLGRVVIGMVCPAMSPGHSCLRDIRPSGSRQPLPCLVIEWKMKSESYPD